MNTEILKDAIEHYKADFVKKTWPDERYKWQAIKCFQDNWDIDAEDFAGMLKKALADTGNLLASAMNFPRGMMEFFAEKAPNEVRGMFIELFDESQEIVARILKFKEKAQELLETYGDESKPNHYQNEHAITIYLWLKYPDKYYIYKYTVAKRASQKLDAGYEFKIGIFEQNMRNFYSFYNELHTEAIKAESLIALLKSQLTEKEYPDPEYRTLTTDISYYISQNYQDTEKDKNNPKENGGEKLKPPPTSCITPYTRADFLHDVYMSEDKYDRLVTVLKRKKNIILQGAPGVGKTFAAKRLAYSLMEEKDDSRVKLVQFHQNYSYEDFVMGYKPYGDGFELKYGIFYEFCEKARKDANKEYFFIIDEINRGNLSKIFGELLMLIENDYRGTKVVMPGDGQEFAVPDNVCIIGMMNTADRSLAMIDYALRRRFSFFDMEPAYDTEGFRSYQENLHSETLNRLIQQIVALNREIAEDASLGKGFCIGHSYFCGLTEAKTEDLQNIVEFDILPMLAEYWFDEPQKLQQWQNALLGVFHE